MFAARRWALLLLPLLLLPLLVSSEQRIITAEPGQDVTLTCGAPNNTIPIIVVKWSRADLESEHALLFRDKQFDPDGQHPSFKNRVDLQDRQMKDGDVSLILKNVTTDDGGTYECRVVQRRTNQERRELKTISIIELEVVPPGEEDGGGEGGGEKDAQRQGGGEKGGGEKDGGEKEGGENGNSRGHLGLVPVLSVGIIIPAAVAALWISKRHQKKKSAPPPDEAAVQQLV